MVSRSITSVAIPGMDFCLSAALKKTLVSITILIQHLARLPLCLLRHWLNSCYWNLGGFRSLRLGTHATRARPGRAIAASFEAKRLGITTGTLVREAKQICPAVIPVQARRRLYTEYHERMLAAVDACAPGLS